LTVNYPLDTSVEKPAVHLTQQGPEGIRFDFNDGCRVYLPPGNWHVTLRDLDTHTILFSEDVTSGYVQSSKRYYVRFRIEIKKHDQDFFVHEMNLKRKPVLIFMQQGGIGDHLAWFGHVAEFARKHECHLTCVVRSDVVELL